MSTDSTTPSPAGRRPLHRRIGPGIITACVVIGPGSVLTSTKVGATYGFQLVWVLLIAVILMMTYMTLGARLGVLGEASPADLVARHLGRWVAVAIGLCAFGISSAFQFGNSLGIHAAIAQFASPEPGETSTLSLILLVAFNLAAIGFLFAFSNLYRWLERAMVVFVFLMLGAFLVNLAFARPDLGALARGLIPSIPGKTAGEGADWVPVLGWIGTTFITMVAYNQAYLVRRKGWGRSELRDGITDARLGSLLTALLTLLLLATAATVLAGERIEDVGRIADQLRPSFGATGHALFCLGLFCAAYSSFLVNSLIGGYVLADGFRLADRADDRWPRRFAALVMLVGLGVAVISRVLGISTVPAVVFAQALTVVAAPAVGGVLWWLTASRRVLGENRNGPITNLLAGVGFLVLLAFSGYLVIVRIIPAVREWLTS